MNPVATSLGWTSCQAMVDAFAAVLAECGVDQRRRWGNLEYWMQVELAARPAACSGAEVLNEELPYLTATPASGRHRDDDRHWKWADLIIKAQDDSCVLLLELKQIPVRSRASIEAARKSAPPGARINDWPSAAKSAGRDLASLGQIRLPATIHAIGAEPPPGGELGWLRMERFRRWARLLEAPVVGVGVLALITWDSDDPADEYFNDLTQEKLERVILPSAGQVDTGWKSTPNWRLWGALGRATRSQGTAVEVESRR